MLTLDLKNRIIQEMKDYFGADEKRINHALSVLKYAEMLLESEGGDPSIVVPAAILHDIGIKEAERKYNSSAGKYQEIEGPPIARKILEKLGVEREKIDRICELIACHHSPGKLDTGEFKVLYDADWLVNLPEMVKEKGLKVNAQVAVNRLFYTQTAKKVATQVLSQMNQEST